MSQHANIQQNKPVVSDISKQLILRSIVNPLSMNARGILSYLPFSKLALGACDNWQFFVSSKNNPLME